MVLIPDPRNPFRYSQLPIPVDCIDAPRQQWAGPVLSPTPARHSQPAVVPKNLEPARTTGCGSVTSTHRRTGGQDVSRLAVSGRMDSRENGSWNGFCAGEPGETGSCAKPICGRHVVSPMRHIGAYHPPSAVRWRDHDLRRRNLLRGVPPGRGEHPISPGPISPVRVFHQDSFRFRSRRMRNAKDACVRMRQP